MKTIGILGGMSWESTAVYYRLLNELAKQHLGETHSCPLLMYSFDFDPLRRLSFEEEWEQIGDRLAEQAVNLERAGAECLLISANTMHRVADQVQARIGIPIINLVDAVGARAKKLDMRTIGVLGTRFTMQGEFYSSRLAARGLNVLIPDAAGQEFVHRAIYDEMVLGKFSETTRSRIAEIAEELRSRGADGIVLGCTELPMLLKPEDCAVPFLDTTLIHCRAAMDFALG